MLSLSEKMIEFFKTEKDPEDVIEKYLENLIEKDPYNIDLWLRLAIVESDSPIIDHDKAFACIERVFVFDPNNYKAILLYLEMRVISSKIPVWFLEKLNNIKYPSYEYESMIQYLLHWHYSTIRDFEKKIEVLERSVQLYQGHVHNNFRLGQYYYEQGRKKEALLLFERALKNIVKVYTGTGQDHDYTDVNEYIAEFITGIHATEILVNRIEQAILKCKNEV